MIPFLKRGVPKSILFLAVSLTGGRLWAQTIDHSAGFAANADLTANGNAVFAPMGAPSVARLTPAVGNQAGSFWHTATVAVGKFTNTFTFQFSAGSTPIADGITFTIQNLGVTAVGTAGMDLGYAPTITPSVAVTFKTYDAGAATNGFSTLLTNGAVPPTSASVAPVNLSSGNVFQADMTYDGTNLSVTLTDTVTNQVFTAAYPIDIPTTVGGGGNAFVGFTGGTGGSFANGDILTWVFNNAPPATPTGVVATNAPPPPWGAVTVTWTAVPGAASYTVSRGTSAGGPFTVVGNSPTNSFIDYTAVPGTTYFYTVTATNVVGTSASSAPSGAVTVTVPPPKSPTQSRTCGCATVVGSPSFRAAGLLALLALSMAVLLRRR